MARTPSLTAAGAERLLGPRGQLRVTSANRVTVRKWLTARGVPGRVANSLPLAELQQAYNDTSDLTLTRLRLS